MKKKMKSLVDDYKLLQRSVPSLIVALFVVSVVCMNLLANKTIIMVGDWFALDAGFLVSWMSFLTMDVVTKRFGARAATRLSIIAMIVNLLCCLIFFVVSIIPSSADDYTALNSILGGTWFILLSSTIAFLFSALINNNLNVFIGKFFKGDGKGAYAARTYISTFVGQFLDNLVFAILTFTIFAPIFWDGFRWSIVQCITCSIVGALAELLMEVIFSPIGYAICKKWKEEDVGREYLDAHPEVET